MRSEYDRLSNGGKRAANSPMNSLTRRKEQAIAALLSHKNLTDAARDCKISERTLRRWLRNKQFAGRFRRERAMLLDGVVDVIKAAAVGAVEVLVAIMQGKRMPASSRVAAASRILEFSFKSPELQTLEKRIAQLEEMAKGRP
jgi:hypothetical protein